MEKTESCFRILSMLGMFAGEYMALWEAIVQRAAQFEGVSQEQIDALRADLREDISQAG